MMISDVHSIFLRSITAHLPLAHFDSLQKSSILMAGLGGGSNVAELLVRKGFGNIILADPDHYEDHNIRQRGCAQSSLNRNKTMVMMERLMDIQPHVSIAPYPMGVTRENIPSLVEQSDIVIDMLDFSALKEKIDLSRETRRQGKYLLTAPSIVNGGVLFVFSPHGMSLEEFLDLNPLLSTEGQAIQQMQRIIPVAPSEAPMEMYLDAAKGNRSIPLDAVGVDQASVMLVCAAENIILNRLDRVLVMPQALQLDASNPLNGYHIHDYSHALT